MTLLVFLSMTLIGGANAALVKFTVSQFPPVVLVALRATLAALIILPIILQQKAIGKSSFKPYLLLANLLFAANWLFFAMGVGQTSVLMSQVIYLPTSLIVAIIGFLFLKEKLSKNQIFGLVLTMFGMSILIFGSMRSQDILSFGKPIGNILVSLGLLSWSIYLVVSRKISSHYSPLTIIFLNFCLTAFFSTILSKLEFTQSSFKPNVITPSGVLALIALVLFSSVIFFYLYQWLIKHTSAFISSLVLYTTAISGSLAGIIFYGEKLTFVFIIGSFFVLFGVFSATSYQYVKKYIKI